MSKEKEMLKDILANTNAIMKHLGLSTEVPAKKESDKSDEKSQPKANATSPKKQATAKKVSSKK